VTMDVELVEPEGELWSGQAEMVIARTLDGEIGLLTNHAPLIGILYEGGMVQIRPENGNGADIFAAVTGGFLSMANNRVSILARQAQLGQDVDPAAAQAALDRAIQEAGPAANAPEEPSNIRYYRALLRAAAGQGS
jgi:F-type H+-transporting ATPase subunit epsilon